MRHISLRPEFITSGGEACGIMLDDQYVGSLTLLYREQDRIWGTVQLDEEMVGEQEKEDIDFFIHSHIENMIDALDSPDCIVTSTYSTYDHIISTDLIEDNDDVLGAESDYDDVEAIEYEMVDDFEEEYEEDDDTTYYDIDEEDLYELVIVGEDKNQVEYQLFDEENDLIAEAMIKVKGSNVKGKVFWNYMPDDDEIDRAASSIVTDFDEEQIRTFRIKMFFEDEELVVIDLANDRGNDVFDENYYVEEHEDNEFPLHFERIFNEDHTVIFDIYEETQNNNRIGTVTILKGSREVKGYLDFINPLDEQIREQIAYRLITEVDKEVDYDSFSLTMMYLGEIIDEFVFDELEQPYNMH
ncbi:hypothetical protein ACJ2A9_04970 [Anaerobacillus sp. MEB173]|uniref:hypothetical protein n=1 Tax=Anaerobacillus sp. MEB173 TaxID=3383345 RepID=UPI003F931BEA